MPIVDTKLARINSLFVGINIKAQTEACLTTSLACRARFTMSFLSSRGLAEVSPSELYLDLWL